MRDLHCTSKSLKSNRSVSKDVTIFLGRLVFIFTSICLGTFPLARDLHLVGESPKSDRSACEDVAISLHVLTPGPSSLAVMKGYLGPGVGPSKTCLGAL